MPVLTPILPSDSTIFQLLEQTSVFRPLSAEAIAALAAAFTPIYYPAGTLIFFSDEPVSGLFLVESGIVKITRMSREGREYIIHLVFGGDTFNDVAVLDGGTNPATAIAHTDANVWRISRQYLHAVADRYPMVAWCLSESIARRARHLVDLVEDLSARTVRGRLARLLLEQAREHDSPAVPRLLTQEEMASRLGTVREMVGRTLRSLAAEGVIDFNRQHITILDVEQLAEEAAV